MFHTDTRIIAAPEFLISQEMSGKLRLLVKLFVKACFIMRGPVAYTALRFSGLKPSTIKEA